MSTTVITTTRDRPECLSLLLLWLSRQTISPNHHLIISDGAERPRCAPHGGTETELKWRVSGVHRYAVGPGREFYARTPKEGEPFSLKANWLYVIPKVRADKVIICEDDDWYHPEYCRKIMEALEEVDMVGISGDYYWNHRTRKHLRMHNTRIASLAATAFRASVLPQFQQIVEWSEDVWFDKRLWEQTLVRTKLLPNVASDGRALHVGIKGMPGAAGLGKYHGDDGVPDPAAEQLTNWIGLQDSLIYQRLPRVVTPTNPEQASS